MRNRPAQAIYVPPHMRKAPQNAAESHEGGVSLNDNVAFDNGVTFNDGAAGTGGVGPRVGEDAQSSTQPTTAPPSAATAPAQPPEQVQQTNESTNAWGQTPPPTAPQDTMDNRHSQKQDNTYIKSKRNSKWATNKEIRERVMKDSNEHIGAWGSNGSDTGFNSNPGADPQHDIKKLVDWEGNWLPGPTDWESRRSFHHHNFNEEMMRFVYGSIDKDATVDVRNEPSFLSIPNGEVAPSAWASIRIEGTSLQEWWSNHVGSSLAEPDSKAWWRDYISEESSLLVPYHVPEAKVDPADTEGQILYVHDLGSGHASDKLMERRNKKKADRERRNAREREQHAALAAEMKPATFQMPEKIKPKISLYIRPALAADAHQIAGIYNHYVDESIRSAEVMPLSALSLSQRIADETASGMPWLVACQKGRKAGRGYTNGTDAMVLGFACASDFLSRQSMIGSCLMDRLLYVLDPLYDSPGGYQFTGTGPFAEHGGSRVIGSVIMNVPFDKKDPADLKGVVNFLGKFGLKKEAELANIGVKQEMHVSLAVFRYTTGNTIDPKSAILR
ncbi:Acyl- n-acyltransferase [Lasiodiplodia theobromae]|uniref:Acyl- n-acyltransferase n=1 Tax=Lasiodiplodia theobromae TaxID=45133 RepID=UPI0015C38A09|nr:Acyl- n-acyltransferase [Lasiodiplodia theobromae]KAF4545371.1 Acyl- n-acyltransferase [Lasiodiplodia theobromae]